MMSPTDIIVIVLSLVSLVFSLVASFFAIIVTTEAKKGVDEKRRMEDLARIREASRIEVTYADIEAQLELVPKKEVEQIIQVKAKRRLQDTGTDTKIAGL